MKKYNIFAAVTLLCGLSLVSCDSDEKEDNLTPSTVYIVNSGVQDIKVYNTGETYTHQVGIYKAGALKSDADVKVAVFTEVELETYNTENNTGYSFIPSTCYTIDRLQVSFGSGQKDVNQMIKVDFDAASLKALPAITGSYVLPVRITESSIDINNKKDISIIHPTVADPIAYFKNEGKEYKYTYGDFKATVFEAPIELDIDNNKWDIELEAEVDESYVNQYGDGDFTLLDANTYSFDKKISLPIGSKGFTLKVNIDGSAVEAGKYILPIRLKKISKFDIDIDRDLYFVAVDIAAPLLDRENWTIAGFSTEEAVGESDGRNGRAIHMIDDDTSTFWHSKWSDGEGKKPPVPHEVIIDMQEVFTITQIDLVRRNNNKDLKAGEFWLSADNKEFIKIGDFSMADTNDAQLFPVTRTDGRYLKIIMTESNNGDQCTSLAELMAHGY